MNEEKIEFGQNDEPILSNEEELEIYGEIPEDVPEVPQSHDVEENYEVGDTYIQEE